MIKAYKEEVFCAVVNEMITAQVLFVSGCKKIYASIIYCFRVHGLYFQIFY